MKNTWFWSWTFPLGSNSINVLNSPYIPGQRVWYLDGNSQVNTIFFKGRFSLPSNSLSTVMQRWFTALNHHWLMQWLVFCLNKRMTNNQLYMTKQAKSEGFDSCDRHSTLAQIGFISSIFSAHVTLKFDRWPWNTIGNLFHAIQVLCIISKP